MARTIVFWCYVVGSGVFAVNSGGSNIVFFLWILTIFVGYLVLMVRSERDTKDFSSQKNDFTRP